MHKLLGTQLNYADQQHVLATFYGRFTREHNPAWADKLRHDGSSYPVQFASDVDWLAHTYFAVHVGGRLDRRVHFCESSPTWPDNPELRNSNLLSDKERATIHTSRQQVTIPVNDALKEAEAILTSALCDIGAQGRHSNGCAAQAFAKHNGCLPPTHPAWKLQPLCDCWVGQAAQWLKDNREG